MFCIRLQKYAGKEIPSLGSLSLHENLVRFVLQMEKQDFTDTNLRPLLLYLIVMILTSRRPNRAQFQWPRDKYTHTGLTWAGGDQLGRPLSSAGSWRLGSWVSFNETDRPRGRWRRQPSFLISQLGERKRRLRKGEAESCISCAHALAKPSRGKERKSMLLPRLRSG